MFKLSLSGRRRSEGAVCTESHFGEKDLRALAICAGCVLAASASCFGVDGILHALAGTLVGFGVGIGVKRGVTDRDKLG